MPRRRRSSVWSTSSARRCRDICSRWPSRPGQGQSAAEAEPRTAISSCRSRTSTRCSTISSSSPSPGRRTCRSSMLAELKDILDRMQTGNFADSAKQQRAAKMMKDMKELVVASSRSCSTRPSGAKREAERRATARNSRSARPAADGIRQRHVHGPVRRPQKRERARRPERRGQRERSGPAGRPRPEGRSAAARRAAEASEQPRRAGRASSREQAAEPDRPHAHRRRRSPPKQFEDAGKSMKEAKECARRRQSRPRHPGAKPGARPVAQGRAVDGRADDGERRRRSPARASRTIMAAIRSAGPTAPTVPISASASRCRTRSTSSGRAKFWTSFAAGSASRSGRRSSSIISSA